MGTDSTDKDQKDKLLFKELTYKLRGAFFDVANQYGLGHREKLYHKALIDVFGKEKINFLHETQIPIYSWQDGRKIGLYIPDFIVDAKVIIEVKSESFIAQSFITQTYSYLRVTDFELALIVNFGASDLQIRRILFTRDRKPHLRKPTD